MPRVLSLFPFLFCVIAACSSSTAPATQKHAECLFVADGVLADAPADCRSCLADDCCTAIQSCAASCTPRSSIPGDCEQRPMCRSAECNGDACGPVNATARASVEHCTSASATARCREACSGWTPYLFDAGTDASSPDAGGDGG